MIGATISPAMVYNARNVLAKTKAFLEEARKNPDCEALVALLEERHATFGETFRRFEARESDVPNASSALHDAKAELERAQCAPHSADREQALRREDDLVHARSVLVVRQHELDTATSDAQAPLRAILDPKIDVPRVNAERYALGAASFCLKNWYPTGDAATQNGEFDPAKLSDEEHAWSPLYEARALATYKDEAKTTSRPSRPIEDLAAAFAMRRTWRAARLKLKPGPLPSTERVAKWV